MQGSEPLLSVCVRVSCAVFHCQAVCMPTCGGLANLLGTHCVAVTAFALKQIFGQWDEMQHSMPEVGAVT